MSTGSPGTSHKRINLLITALGIPNSTTIPIENKDVQTAPGVELSSEQKLLVGSVFDLFAGYPSHAKLSLWKDDASFEDPITIAKGRDKYNAQWWGLAEVFSKIDPSNRVVTSSGNPITIDMTTTYTLKGVNKDTTIKSLVEIYTDPADGKITRVLDKWDGNLPDSSFKNAFRKLNAVSVPKMVSVPKTD
ncbi:MAG: hypothetical protein M1824_000013 [Vezdaea acicularis]|nr:MAG: hypothetical protein M1824_000013 [Vezdaea acicularis]